MTRKEAGPVTPGSLLQSEELSSLVQELNRGARREPSPDTHRAALEVPDDLAHGEAPRRGDGEPVHDHDQVLRAAVAEATSLPLHGDEAADRPRSTQDAGMFGGRWSAQRRSLAGDSPLGRLLADVRDAGASDLHLVTGQPLRLRVDGRLVQRGAAVSESTIEQLFAPCLTQRERHQLAENAATDLSLRLEGGAGGRFRVNLHRQAGTAAASVRALPMTVPSLESLQLPRELESLVDQETGLVLVCGPTGSGKSSTLAALLERINRQRAVHIVTIEEPIEYEHRPVKALVEQIEIGVDAPSFPQALRAALRQDPDVILLGEMRDLESLSTALTAAETGHLILSTLHTTDAGQSIHRIVDLYPENSQNQVRQQLAMSLNAVVCQRLLPRADGPGVVPAVELLRATFAVRQHIRTGQIQKIYNELTIGRKHGMVSLEASLAALVRSGVVDRGEAMLRSRRPEELESLLRS